MSDGDAAGAAPHLSVITPTRGRPQLLAQCLSQYCRQSLGGLRCEHVVVADGPDPMARALAKAFHARYLELPEPFGGYGGAARDLALRHSLGEYVCFWDDDNLYEPHALAVAYATTHGHDIGVTRALLIDRDTGRVRFIPGHWTGTIESGGIDSMCVCVRRELALSARWADAPDPACNDFHYFSTLARFAPRIRYSPIVIGAHV